MNSKLQIEEGQTMQWPKEQENKHYTEKIRMRNINPNIIPVNASNPKG
jgi:hypothetical protein